MRSPSEHSLSDSDSSSSMHSQCPEDQPATRDEQFSRVHMDRTSSQCMVPLLERFTGSSKFIANSEVSFTEQDYVGQGSISFVFKGQMRGKEVAVKVLRLDTDETDEDGLPLYAKDFSDELNIVSMKLEHPAIMGFFGAGITVFCNSEVPMLVYEYMQGGSVDDLFERKRKENNGVLWKPPSAISLSWCRQLLEALSYLHNLETPLAHRDIKPANLLVSKDMVTLKLADFSLAKPITKQQPSAEVFAELPSIAGSLRYMAPEVTIAKQQVDLAKSDVYSAALTCWTMTNGQRPFSNVADAQLAHVLASQGLRPPVKNNAFGAILAAAWEGEATARPTAEAMRGQLAALEQRKESKRIGGWGKKMLCKVKTSLGRLSSC